MKRIFFAVAALAIAGAAALTPANAQGVGVQVGPVGVGVGVGPYWDDGYHHRYWHGRDYAYASDCRVIRERIETPSGRMIVQTTNDKSPIAKFNRALRARFFMAATGRASSPDAA
jgi:hypothetical protein